MSNSDNSLAIFVEESFAIEGIQLSPEEFTRAIAAHKSLLAKKTLTVAHLTKFVEALEPGAILRDQAGLDVRVGSYVAPSGGSHIADKLKALLNLCAMFVGSTEQAFTYHTQYEALHPFTDCNGRSGRAVWLWMMPPKQRFQLSFLHAWYYQSLRAKRHHFFWENAND